MTQSPTQKHPAISVESGYLDGSWQGHFRVTCVALMSLLERTLSGEEQFSSAERMLFVACEFWAAFNAGELDTYFDLKADDPMRDARTALRVVGDAQVADLLEAGALGPAGGRANTRRRQRLSDVEQKIAALQEPVDLLIARFAWRYMSMQRRRPATAHHLAPDWIAEGLLTHAETRR